MLPIAQRVDRNGPVPAYHQVAMDIRERLRREEFPPGAKLPTEKDLARHYGVSRVTLRQALAELEKNRLIDRRHGTGTFVSVHAPAVVHDLSAPLVFAARMRERGLRLRPRVIEFERTAVVPGQARRALQLAAEEPVYHLLRVFDTEDGPIEIVHHWLAVRRFPGLDQVPLIDGSLTTTLAARYQFTEAEAEVWLESATGLPAECALLDTGPNQVLTSMSRSVYEADGSVSLHSQSLWSAESIRFHFRVKSAARAGGEHAVTLTAPA